MIDLIVSPLLLPGDLLIVPKRHFMAPALERAKSFSRPPQQSVTVRRKRWSLSKVGCIKQTAAVSNIAAQRAWHTWRQSTLWMRLGSNALWQDGKGRHSWREDVHLSAPIQLHKPVLADPLIKPLVNCKTAHPSYNGSFVRQSQQKGFLHSLMH